MPRPLHGPAMAIPSVAGRVPPHDLDAEASILSCVMLETGAIAWAGGRLRAEHFYSEANGRIWEACLAIAGVGQPVDAVTVARWLDDRERLRAIGGRAYLASIVDATPHVDRRHFAAYLEIVKLAWQKRARIAVYQRAAAELYGDVGDPHEFFAATDLELLKLRREGSERSRPERAFEILSKRLQEVMAEASGKPGRRKVWSGMADIDRHTGGWTGGDLIYLAARPGMGKSSWAFDVAANTAIGQGYGAAVFSVEMMKYQVTDRMLCQRAGVNGKRLSQGKLLDSDWSKLTTAATDFGPTLPLWVQGASGITLEEIRAQAVDVATECERQGVPLALLVVDHIGIMKPHDMRASREQQIAVISGGLKALAKELDAVVLALSQLSRAVESRPVKDRRPQLSDLRDSGAIEQDGDQVVMLYRDHYYDDTKDPTVAEAIWRKFRGGELATVTQRWDGPTTRFSDLGGYDSLGGQW